MRIYKNCSALKKRKIAKRTQIQSTKYKTHNNNTENKIRSHRPAAESWDRCAPVCWHGFHELGIKTGKQANSEIQIEGHGDIQIEKYTSTEIQETETLSLKIHMDTGRKRITRSKSSNTLSTALGLK